MKISVIICTLNEVTKLPGTVSSVLEQKNVDFEIVLIDGVSTDGTLDLIKGYAARYPDRVKWRCDRDKGVYQAINRGLELATGDVIGILHAGDRYTSPDILRCVQAVIERGAPYVYGDIHYVKPSGRTVRHYSSKHFAPRSLRYGFAPPHPSLYVTREVAEKIGPYREDYITAADFEYFVRLMLVNGIDGAYLPTDMVMMSTGGLSSQWRHRLSTNVAEKLRAFHDNGLPAHRMSMMIKYWLMFTFRI